MSRREQIQMSAEEVGAFLEQQRVVICATNGRDGWPHLMPLWYLVRNDEIWAWTYAKSQKVRNLERDARATLQVEDGQQYHELRGVMIEARAEIHRELDQVAEFGAALFARYGGGGGGTAGGVGTAGGGGGGGTEFLDVIRAQASKRVAIQFVPKRIATWDHRKLGGAY